LMGKQCERVWCNGNMSISKIVDRGSIPFTLVAPKGRLYIIKE
jgi:hypothetical protein